MSQRSSQVAYSEDDFHALEATLMQSDRGRWFLEEHARRRASLETRTLLGSLERLERVVAEQSVVRTDALPREIEGIAAALTQMMQDLVGRPDTADRTDPFARIVVDAEQAAALIAGAGARIVEITQAMEAQGADREICDALRMQTEVSREALGVHIANARRVKALAEILIYARRRLAALAAEPAADHAAA